MQKVSNLTAKSKFIKPNEISFLKTDERLSRVLDSISGKLLEKVNESLHYVSSQRRVFEDAEDVNDTFEKAGDIIDSLFERAVWPV